MKLMSSSYNLSASYISTNLLLNTLYLVFLIYILKMAYALLAVGGGVAGLAVAVKSYLKATTGTYKIEKDLNGKIFLITGASSGIGKETVKEIARAGGTVYMPCRNILKGENVANEIRKETGNDKIFVDELNLSSFKSVRKFAAKFLATQQPLHVLINNAGVIAQEQKITEDGLEETMQANHLGHFLLTKLLLERLKESSPSRIVNVSSMAHKRRIANFDLTDLNCIRRKFVPWEVYSWSKLCNVLFTSELSKRLIGTGVTTNSLHPGFINTNLFRDEPIYLWPIFILLKPFMKSQWEGAQTSLYLAISDEVEFVSGHYFSDCRPSIENIKAMDTKLAQELWEESEKLTHLKEE